MAALRTTRKGTIVAGLVAIAIILLDPSCSRSPGGAPGTLSLIGDEPICYDPDEIEKEMIDPPDPGATRQYLFAQFSSVPTSDERRVIERESAYHIRFLDSHGDRSYTMSILTDRFKTSLIDLKNGKPAAECISELARSNRSSKRLDGSRENLRGYDPNDGGTPPLPMITVYVRFFDNVPVVEQRLILGSYGVLNVDQLDTFNDEWRVTLPDQNLDNLRDDRQVQWVEELEEAPIEDMDAARAAINLPDDYLNGGDGTLIAQWEICHPANAPPEEHPDLANRASSGISGHLCSAVIQQNNALSVLPTSSHATQVAGVMMGDGSASEIAGDAAYQWHGIAPQSRLVSYSVADQDIHGLFSEYLDAAQQGAIVSNNSWGATFDDYYHRPLTKSYPFRSAFFDMISSLRNSAGWPAGPGHRILIVASSGNRGGDKIDPDNSSSARYYWRTARVRNSAKNVLTVGNVASGQGTALGWPAFNTGRGPTSDGRLKPDLVAPGAEIKNGALASDNGIKAPVYPYGILPNYYYEASWGTSFSTPIVSGAAALLTTTIREGACNRNPTPAELRALLINTAMDITDASNEASLGGLLQQQYAAQDLLANLEAQFFGTPRLSGAPGPPYVLDNPPAGVDALVGPDYVFGYGMVQPVRADEFATNGHFLRAKIDRGFIEYPIVVRLEDLEDQKLLRVTLAWDDPPFAMNSLPDPQTGILQNDLDLMIIGPFGRRYFPWKLDPANPAAAATQASRSRFAFWPRNVGDHTNTVEQVAIAPSNAQLGETWKVRVYGSTMRLPEQEFALASSIINPAAPCGIIASRVVLKPITPPKTKIFWVLFIIGLIMLLLLLLWLAEKIYDAYKHRGPYVAVSRIILAYLVLFLIAAALFYWSDALMGSL